MSNPQPPADYSSAVEQTLHLLDGNELDVAVTPLDGTDGQGRPVIDVVNLDTGKHWHLIVDDRPQALQ